MISVLPLRQKTP